MRALNHTISIHLETTRLYNTILQRWWEPNAYKEAPTTAFFSQACERRSASHFVMHTCLLYQLCMTTDIRVRDTREKKPAQRQAVHCTHQRDNTALQCIIGTKKEKKKKKKVDHHVHTSRGMLTMMPRMMIITCLASFSSVPARNDATSVATHLPRNTQSLRSRFTRQDVHFNLACTIALSRQKRVTPLFPKQ